MKGHEYADLISLYLVTNFGERGIEVYREVALGKTIVGKNRRVDMLVVHEIKDKALAIECKYQASSGTADEKIPYTLADLDAMRVPACVVYAGDGFSAGIQHMLAASPAAAYCMPNRLEMRPSEATRELDHILAATFGWWDVVLGNKRPFTG